MATAFDSIVGAMNRAGLSRAQRARLIRDASVQLGLSEAEHATLVAGLRRAHVEQAAKALAAVGTLARALGLRRRPR